MQYEPAARPVSGTPAARRRPSGTTDTAVRRARPSTIKTSQTALPHEGYFGTQKCKSRRQGVLAAAFGGSEPQPRYLGWGTMRI